nr:MAG TPA: hypothetical protein [Bacteriophage sp.]
MPCNAGKLVFRRFLCYQVTGTPPGEVIFHLLGGGQLLSDF